MEKGTKNILIGVFVGVVAILLVLLMVNYSPPERISDEEKNAKSITLTKENFAYVDYDFLNQVFIETSCEGINAGDCEAVFGKPNAGDCRIYSLTLRYKLVNLPEELLSRNNWANRLQFKGFSNGEALFWKYFDEQDNFVRNDYSNTLRMYDEENMIVGIDFPVDITRDNSVMLCAQLEDASYQGEDPHTIYPLYSNEVCLDAVNVEAIC